MNERERLLEEAIKLSVDSKRSKIIREVASALVDYIEKEKNDESMARKILLTSGQSYINTPRKPILKDSY